MQLAGAKSWAIATDQPLMLLIALYVRDASGLRPQLEPVIPELVPATLGPLARATVDPSASMQWDVWWRQLLEGGGFWPEHLDARDLARNNLDPEIAKLHYWPAQFAPPDFPGLSGSRELQSLVHRHHEAAFAWCSARKSEWAAVEGTRSRIDLVSVVVKEVERSLGRSARPFRLDVRLLPVAGYFVWRTSAGRALMSLTMYRDRAAFEGWLAGVVRELA